MTAAGKLTHIWMCRVHRSSLLGPQHWHWLAPLGSDAETHLLKTDPTGDKGHIRCRNGRLRLAYNRHGTGSRSNNEKKTAEAELLMGVHVVSEFDHMTITMGMQVHAPSAKFPIPRTAGDGRPVGWRSWSVSGGGRRQSAPCTPTGDYRLPHSRLSDTDQVSFRRLHRPVSVGQYHCAGPPQAQGSRKRHSVRCTIVHCGVLV